MGEGKRYKMDIMDIIYKTWIGKKVKKVSNKPFKSKLKINTVKDIFTARQYLAKTDEVWLLFEEDTSAVEARRCKLVDEIMSQSEFLNLLSDVKKDREKQPEAIRNLCDSWYFEGKHRL